MTSRVPTSDKVKDGGTGTRGEPAMSGRRRTTVIGILGTLVVATLAWLGWLGGAASEIKSELDAATSLVPSLESSVIGNRPQEAQVTVDQIHAHTARAKEVVGEPLWRMATYIPLLGANFSAVTEVARSAHDVADLGLVPLVGVMDSLDWTNLLPSRSGTSLEPLAAASPVVSSAAYAVRESKERLDGIDANNLLTQVATPLAFARERLQEVTATLDTASDVARLAPSMLGADGPREYLLMFQNNAEARATGGIPGALAVLRLEDGKLTLGAQTSATDLGPMLPTLSVEPEQQLIYSWRVGKFMQDVNLTPDFPTAAGMAQAMWERKTGQHVDGVISIDPVALSYILDATGPVNLTQPDLIALASTGLPTQLTGTNVVRTLLSDVYRLIKQPKLQDAYFAGVAQEVFAALADGEGDTKGLIKGIARGSEEGRVLVWSNRTTEQSIIEDHPISGAISGRSVAPAEFGVYFNDGTGAKMDFYVKRTIQLLKQCAAGGYEQTSVRITSTNTAPADAATSLPAYVTGDGVYGVPPGSVQTNIIAYGPVQANVESAVMDGTAINFAPYLHSNRPVGVVAIRLAPGESHTVEFTFSKIVQHTEPNVVVTPTVQELKDVILPTEIAKCG